MESLNQPGNKKNVVAKIELTLTEDGKIGVYQQGNVRLLWQSLEEAQDIMQRKASGF